LGFTQATLTTIWQLGNAKARATRQREGATSDGGANGGDASPSGDDASDGDANDATGDANAGASGGGPNALLQA